MEKKIPVGKIDFLDTNGEVGETCYYYTEEEFLNLRQIKSNLVAYRGETQIGNKSHNALYEIPTSVATINLTPSAISTQETNPVFPAPPKIQ